jgi:hypothetical protein
MNIRSIVCAALICCCLVSCSSKSSVIQGVVTVDGTPVDTGTIHFASEDDAAAKGQGTVIAGGKFELSEKMAAGSYRVMVEGFRTTGRTITDPQRGQVPETVQLQIQNLPVEVQLPAQDSEEVQIALKTTAR